MSEIITSKCAVAVEGMSAVRRRCCKLYPARTVGWVEIGRYSEDGCDDAELKRDVIELPSQARGRKEKAFPPTVVKGPELVNVWNANCSQTCLLSFHHTIHAAQQPMFH